MFPSALPSRSATIAVRAVGAGVVGGARPAAARSAILHHSASRHQSSSRLNNIISCRSFSLWQRPLVVIGGDGLKKSQDPYYHSAACCLLPSNQNCRRSFASSPPEDFSVYYHIEANNAARGDATQLTVLGPDIDGILASMTVALAMSGCSLVELHAAKSVDTGVHRVLDNGQSEELPMIHDIFWVLDRATGKPFEDDKLEPLATSLLEALKHPMNLVGMGAIGGGSPSSHWPSSPPPKYKEQVKIVKSTDK